MNSQLVVGLAFALLRIPQQDEILLVRVLSVGSLGVVFFNIVKRSRLHAEIEFAAITNIWEG